MDLNTALANLRRGVAVADALSTVVGLPGVGKLLTALTEVGEAALKLAEEGKVVVSSGDADAIRSVLKDIQERNDRINAEVRKG